jgi:hypothetical protein
MGIDIVEQNELAWKKIEIDLNSDIWVRKLVENILMGMERIDELEELLWKLLPMGHRSDGR